jgi:hypothetical protein
MVQDWRCGSHGRVAALWHEALSSNPSPTKKKKKVTGIINGPTERQEVLAWIKKYLCNSQKTYLKCKDIESGMTV